MASMQNCSLLVYFVENLNCEKVYLLMRSGHPIWRHNTQHYDTQHDDTEHDDTQHNDTKHDHTQGNDTEHNDIQDYNVMIAWFMQSVIYGECHREALYAKCSYTECHYAECRGTPYL